MCFIFACLLILPVILPFLRESTKGNITGTYSWDIIAFSADPFSYITPSPLYNIFGKGFVPMVTYRSFSGNEIESTTYLGLAEITLMILFIGYAGRLRKENELYKYKKWIWLMVVFYILSLGPYLKVINHVIKIPLPMYYFIQLPFVSLARDSVRLSLIVLIGSLIVISLFLNYLSKTLESKIFSTLIFIIAVIFFLERLIIPFPLRNIETSSFFTQLKNDPAQYAIIELPFDMDSLQNYNINQTVHQKNIIYGLIQHTAYNNQTTEYLTKDPVLNLMFCDPLYNESKSYQNVVNYNLSPIKQTKEKYLKDNFKYIIIYKDSLNKIECSSAKTAIEVYFKNSPRVYSDDKLEALEVKDL